MNWNNKWQLGSYGITEQIYYMIQNEIEYFINLDNFFGYRSC